MTPAATRPLPRRGDPSLLGRWWTSIDHWTVAAVLALMAIGVLMILAASPAVAERIDLADDFHFVQRQALLLGPSILLMLGVSLLDPAGVRRLALAVLALALVATAATLVAGAEIKGARRWLDLGGFSLQPTEFLKPAFAVVCAWLFARARGGHLLAAGLFALAMVLILLQPDVGMAVVVAAIWGVEFFLAGLPWLWVAGIVAGAIGGLIAAYHTLDHVRSRIDRFLDPASGDTYQIDRSLEAFTTGGLFGRGPGEGVVKHHLPDAHADFVFAVAGEEFGVVVCLLIVALYGVIVIRGIVRVHRGGDLFVILAVGGLLAQFALQAFINMASTLAMIPTKGMTLPFISYGGSSLLALALAMGMVLALTRHRPDPRARLPRLSGTLEAPRWGDT